MANNYTELSIWVEIPAYKKEAALDIVHRIFDELEADDECAGFAATWEDELVHEKPGVWIREDESASPDGVERLVRALVEELDLPQVISCGWAMRCDKPRLDEFGGGAFVLQKGVDTVWVDAEHEAMRKFKARCKAGENRSMSNKKRYLITCMWSWTTEVELPAGTSLEDIESATPPKDVDEAVCRALQDAAEGFRWKDLVVTDLQDREDGEPDEI